MKKPTVMENEPLHEEVELLSTGGQPSAAGHSWKQRGSYLECQSCVHKHGVSITVFGAQPTDIYTGLDKDGNAMFKKME